MAIMYDPIPESIIRKRTLWGSQRDIWLNKVEKEEEYYYNDVEGTGTNFTVQQLTKISKGTNIPVTINYLHPICNQKLALLLQNKPAFKVVALDSRSKSYAYVLDKAVKSIMYRSEAVGEEEEAIKNMLILGMGINGIIEEPEYQFGTFNLSFQNLHPSIVILDANSRKRNLKDMQGFFIEKEITIEEAKKYYQGLINAINEKRSLEGDSPVTIEEMGQSFVSSPRNQGVILTDGLNQKITVQEYYDKVYTQMYLVEDVNTGDILRLFAENLEEDQLILLENAVDVEANTFVRKTTILGERVVSIEIKSIKDFPIKVKFFEWGGRPYKSYGMIHFTKGMQETLDSTIQNMILNGILTNNAGYTSPKGGIAEEDKSKWEILGNKPGVIKEYVPTVIDGQTFKPEREGIQGLSNFYPHLAEMMRTGIEYSTGINPMVQGNPQEAKIDVFSSLQQYQNAAMMRIQLAMSHINLANEQLGNIMIDMLLSNLNIGQNYVFFDETDNFNEINILREHAKNFKLGRYGVLSISAEAMPTQKMAIATELFKIAQTTSDPVRRDIFVEAAFEKSDMRGFDELREKIDVVTQMQQKVQQMEETINRIQELNKQYENARINAEVKVKIMQRYFDAVDSISTAEGRTLKDLEIAKLKEELKDSKKESEVAQ